MNIKDALLKSTLPKDSKKTPKINLHLRKFEHWEVIDNPWKRAFALAWESYKRNCIPIGAVIIDEDGNTISEGRNMIFEESDTNYLAGTRMGHAEMVAMFQIRKELRPRNIRTCTLYTTLEPCPMCFGTITMMNIRNVKFASKDRVGGATDLNDKLDYISRKNIKLGRGTKELDLFQMVLMTAYEYNRNSEGTDILDKWRIDCSEGVELGCILAQQGFFKEFIDNNSDVSLVYNAVICQYKKLNNYTSTYLKKSI